MIVCVLKINDCRWLLDNIFSYFLFQKETKRKKKLFSVDFHFKHMLNEGEKIHHNAFKKYSKTTKNAENTAKQQV